MSRRRNDDGDDWKTRFTPGYQATPLSIRILLGITAFVIQTAFGLMVTENLSFFLNGPTVTIITATLPLVSLLLWIAMDLGKGIERKHRQEQEEHRDEERSKGLTSRQRVEVENLVHRTLQRERRTNDNSNETIAAILGSLSDSETTVDDLDIADAEVREQVKQLQDELARVRQSQITEAEIREIVAESVDTGMDSQEVHRIAGEIESRIDEAESRVEDNQKTLNAFYRAVKRDVDEFEPVSVEETEKSSKSQEGGRQTGSQETNERESEFEK